MTKGIFQLTNLLVLFSLWTQVGCFLNAGINSLSISATEELPSPIEAPAIPVDPENVQVKVVLAKEGNIVWSAGAANVTGYKVALSPSQSPNANCESDIVATGDQASIDLASLLPDTTYYFRICSTNGSVASTGVTGSFKTLKLLARSAAYPSFSNWNDHLLNNGTRFYNANQTVCDVTLHWGFNVCINGGLVQKIVVPGINDCSRLKVFDQLGVFRWACDPSGSDAVVYSTDLNRHKGLSDLIVDNQFKNNSVIVQVDGQSVYASEGEKWWTNAIETLPDSPNGATTTLTNGGQSSGKIFTVSATRTGGAYSINEDKISIVVLKYATLIKDASNTTDLITAASPTKFLWFEGSFSGNNQSLNVIDMWEAPHSRLHNIELAYATNALVFCGGDTHSVKITDFYFHHSPYGYEGPSTPQSWMNLLVNGHVSNMTDTGIRYLTFSAISNVVFSGSSGSRGSVSYSRNNNHVNLTFANNSMSNSIYNFSSENNLFHNMLSVNSAMTGALYNYQARGHTFSNLMLVGGGSSDVKNSNTRAPLKFTNNLVLESAARCEIYNDTAWSPGLLTDGSCGNAGPSDAILRLLTFDQPKIFLGKVSTDDQVNPNDTSGLASITGISNWSRFENQYRAWGIDGSTFPNTDNKGDCTTGNCRIWDYRLKADAANIAFNSTDTVIAKNGAFIPGSTCPAAVHGNKSTTYVDYFNATHTFLTNAMEVSLDGVGNDDGLCESNESCLYTPNFGAYQGEGDYEAAGTCLFQNGTITGVKLFAYPINGI